ncbi:DUF4230 domain-containing protein [Fulvivirgaceae bacterium BMA10]|uniref:DUF4230 domain-containing protein n=1 Tax=Splendidivirga corallicola TaxID=3051826 RepID=A0ABT8KNM1_9BACT|nr:DUF4230 domain-containing protein [Fulvivirgaceae bacterium BMA10]
MILIFKYLIRHLPWILVVILLVWLYLSGSFPGAANVQREIITNELVLEKVESLGRLELVKYNFKEITDIKNTSSLKMFFQSYTPDMKAVLITNGEAVGCLDLAKLTKDDIHLENDTISIRLPEPELCYYKLHLERSRIYALDIGFLASSEEERKLVEDLYKTAEKEVKQAALNSGILEETRLKSEIYLKRFLEEVSGKKVFLYYEMRSQELDLNK